MSIDVQSAESETKAVIDDNKSTETRLVNKIKSIDELSTDDRDDIQDGIKKLTNQVNREIRLSTRLTRELAAIKRERDNLSKGAIGGGCNELEPYATKFPERNSDACYRYATMVNRGAGPWTNMVSTRIATRSTINEDKGRVQFERMSNADLLESIAPQAVKSIMEKNGLMGVGSAVKRVENDRPRVVSGNIDSTANEQKVGQFLRQINIF